MTSGRGRTHWRATSATTAFAVASLVVLACGKKAPTSVLQAADLQTASDGPFDPTDIVDDPSFTDFTGLDQDEIQDFFDHTPYDQPSFLGTYQSHGVLASEAVARAAATYRLNPLVFIVRAEMDQGLVGLQTYPSPTSRVDYVFGCGEITQGQYDPTLAGFDIQCDCLGASLRASLDEIAQSGQTDAGWGPGIANETLDNVSVTPQDASTAALYQYEPLVGLGSSGNWLEWSIWQEYATALNYEPPISASQGGAAIGDACTTATDCSEPGSICATGDLYPGGLCTLQCEGDCPADQVETFCGDFGTSGFCLAVCDPSAPMPCRAGYACVDVQQYTGSDSGAGTAQMVCFDQ